jgi:hypothetical protein
MLKVRAAIAIIIALVIGYFTAPWWTYGSEVMDVNGIMVKQYGSESKYLVYTSTGVYENTDTWYYFKFDSSDVQSKLMRPGKFKVSYYGFRVPFLSKYKNIINVQKVN